MEEGLVLVYVISFLFGILVIILFFKVWGMCNNVASILGILKGMQNHLTKDSQTKKQHPSTTVVEDAYKDKDEGFKFKTGQLVIVRATGKQFRILSAVPQEDGETLYYSQKNSDTRGYKESELADFDEYWAEKGK